MRLLPAEDMHAARGKAPPGKGPMSAAQIIARSLRPRSITAFMSAMLRTGKSPSNAGSNAAGARTSLLTQRGNVQPGTRSRAGGSAAMAQAESTVPPIYLPPSNSQTELLHAIRVATATGRTLLLEPGTHFTTPGQLNTIEIGPHGLEIGSGSPNLPFPAKGSLPAVVRRPDFSIPATAPDDNFGLFFVPAGTQLDTSNATWKPGKDEKGNSFEFAIFAGGSVNIHDLTLDCNMGRQGLESLKDNAAQHSMMLGFAPQWYPAGFAPAGTTPRRAYVMFRNVTVKNLISVNGAFADDIAFVYFRAPMYPIIKEVVVQNITSTRRVGPHRGTIAFGGLPERVNIHTTDVVFLNAESNVDFTAVPRDADVFTRSRWRSEERRVGKGGRARWSRGYGR